MNNTIQNKPTRISSQEEIQRLAQQGQERALKARGGFNINKGVEGKEKDKGLANVASHLAHSVKGQGEPKVPKSNDPVIAGGKPVVPPPVIAGLIAPEPPVMQPVEVPVDITPVESAPEEPVVAGGISVPPPAESVSTMSIPQEK